MLFLGRRSHQGEGHVQFQVEDREAQWREARPVRVRRLPGSARVGDELRPRSPGKGAEYHGIQGN